jgi:succinate dehydrogenase/fumarate reductase flavoprotein subunit
MVQMRVLKALSGLANTDGRDLETHLETTRSGQSLSGRREDPRTGWDNTPYPKGDCFGGAIGMCSHLSSGIFCGMDDLVGYTGLPGLYVAGDGANGAAAAGACYPNGVGFTSSFCSLQGWRAGQAAARYADEVPLAAIPGEKISELSKGILAPLQVKAGLDPNWARDVLQAIMAPYWIHIVKSESTLRGALAQVEYMRDNVAPKLMAASAHDLRLCHEMKHKILSAEMKLRAGLERRESRGLHYRADYPYRDDKNFLCYIAIRKGKNGSMTLSKVNIKDEWKGDLKQDYAKRYGWRFPGEARAKGLPEEQQS